MGRRRVNNSPTRRTERREAAEERARIKRENNANLRNESKGGTHDDERRTARRGIITGGPNAS